MIYDLLIIGGGASGVSALVSYKKYHPSRKALLLESNDELLKKLNATGNGKGNFSNIKIDKYSYNNGEYFETQIDGSNERVIKFFESLSVLKKVDSEGRIYPYSMSAKTLSLSLINKLNDSDFLLNTKVDSIDYKNNIFTVKSNDKVFESYKLLIATGSKNYKTLGSDGSIFPIVQKLGHTFTNIYPSNIYINVLEKDITKKLTGLRFNVGLTLYNNKNILYTEYGELLFKDNALSGIVSFNVSNRLATLYKKEIINNPYITIDFMPEYKRGALSALIDTYKSIEDFIDYTFNSYEITIDKEITNDVELPIHVTLYQALIKNDKFDLVIQKSTELGVTDIVPTIFARSVIKIDKEKENNKLNRYEKIIKEACEQSHRQVMPIIHQYTNLKDIKIDEDTLGIMAYENNGNLHSFSDALANLKDYKNVAIIIGPEGGFEESEVNYLHSIGFKNVSLGNRILRTETAAIYAISVIGFMLER